MFVRVDEEIAEYKIEGFSYENAEGSLEYVVAGNCAVVKDSTGCSVTIFTEDIPKLIKALQAAYDHIQKGK